ncbi:hypothetical protein DBL02_10025 [Acinetobacter oleivorans]|uniref:hypothetical protein n=1 Tax=Acinetobacter oleivorans TaxID=1148157 RepID=UPI000D30B00C|nr:hypothetical protein [Acinetobacter oleivorans]PTV45200.1 hypothetical protein DBL02_10025 [Acinetobacter oleivorans]
MSFHFESNEFKKTFDEVIRLASLILADVDKYPKDIVNIANGLITANQVFNTNIDLSQYDQYIPYSSKECAGFDFVDIVGSGLRKYKVEYLDDNLYQVILISASLIYIYFKELIFQLGGLSPSIALEVGSYERVIGEALKDNQQYSRYIDYGDRELPYQILKDIFHSEEIKTLNNLRQKIVKAESVINIWDESIEAKTKQVELLEEKLNKTKSQYDFVLLNEGFKNLYNQKKEELSERRSSFSKFGATLTITPLLLIIFSFLLFIIKGDLALKYLLYLAFPVSTFLIIIFYFVRVSLQHVRSIQSQMMQLELRMALCQFIYNYAEDSETLHKKNKEGFEKFENIIFSSIVSSDDKIPSTFDGVEQIAKIIEAIKK